MSRRDEDEGTGAVHDDVMNDDEFADVRTALGLAVPPVAPSPGMKSALMAAIATTPQVAPLAAVTPLDESPAAAVSASPTTSAETRAQARWFSRPATLVMAAAAAVALFFGGVLAADLVSPSAPSAADQLAAIVAAPDVSTVVSPVAGGGTSTLVASETAGLSAMVFEGLQPLSDDERYALWYITDGVPTPAGLFAVTGDGAVVQVLEGTFEAGTIVGVTVEPASGSPAPTSDPIVAIATA
ncbi:anti-sigma factor [Microcella sp.]|uniref:anti-sigma factor n=1 Tax=Microcella sp. TaxID=1913979 RepID=UPI00256C4A92|nr:anti-sigma factor [Microcella sp.]MBX9472566.1 anti-sigma factor [Microcella sp.]